MTTFQATYDAFTNTTLTDLDTRATKTQVDNLARYMREGLYNYTKAQADALYNTKVDTETYVADMATKVDTSTFESTVTTLQNDIDTKAVNSEVQSALATKVNTVDYAADMANIYKKSEVDDLVTNGFVATDTFATFSTNVADTYETKTDHAADVATINAAIATKVDSTTYEAAIANIYTKSEVDTELATKVDSSTYTTAIANVYTKSETYTKTEVDEAINAAIADVLERISAQLSGNSSSEEQSGGEG